MSTPHRTNAAPSARPPNVVFIYADDLGRGMLSAYGQRHFRTPNIDRLAREGLRFTHAYGCAFCAPARASLLTGRHDCHRGGWTFSSGIYRRYTEGRLTLDQVSDLLHTTGLNPGPDDVFLAEIAREAGCATGQIGKLEWGFSTTDREIRRHGWDEHYGYYDHAECHGFYPPHLFENGRRVDIPGNTRPDFGKMPDGESPANHARRRDLAGCAVYSQDLFDERLIDFLRRHRDRPFFLYHPSQLPHGPISIPAIDPAVRDAPGLTDYEKEYASMVLRLDRTVGRILDELQRLGIDDRTAVFFCADNGHSVYYRQQGRCEEGRNLRTGEAYDNVATKFYSDLSGDVFDGNDGMAGLKFSNWEGGVRIPFVARWPGRIPAGAVSDLLMANYDFLPTMAEMLGRRPPAGIDGRSYLAELLGDRERQARHEHVVFASGLGPALVTSDGWKMRHVRLPKVNRYQLFRLGDDPREERDLVGEERAVVERLSTTLLRECDGSFLNGMPETHRVYIPGLHFFGPECHWEMAP
jgi:arylsulfatase A-like enzyme